MGSWQRSSQNPFVVTGCLQGEVGLGQGRGRGDRGLRKAMRCRLLLPARHLSPACLQGRGAQTLAGRKHRRRDSTSPSQLGRGARCCCLPGRGFTRRDRAWPREDV